MFIIYIALASEKTGMKRACLGHAGECELNESIESIQVAAMKRETNAAITLASIERQAES
jgi:hypothetical protein